MSGASRPREAAPDTVRVKTFGRRQRSSHREAGGVGLVKKPRSLSEVAEAGPRTGEPFERESEPARVADAACDGDKDLSRLASAQDAPRGERGEKGEETGDCAAG